MKGMSAPKITHTMNEMSKCRKALKRDGAWPLCLRSPSFTVVSSRRVSGWRDRERPTVRKRVKEATVPW